MPDPCIIPDEIRRKRSTGSKEASTAAIIAMRVYRWDILDLLEAVHFLFREL